MATRVRPYVGSLLPPEAQAVQGHRAGVITRTLVMVVDAAVVAGSVGVGYLLWASLRFMRHPARFSWPTATFQWVVLAAAIVCLVYLTTAWTTTGRSVGKRLFGLRVVGGGEQRLHLIRAFLRAGACTFFPFLLYWAAVSRQNRSVQDLVFRTSVVYDWRSRGRLPRPTAAQQGAAEASPLGDDTPSPGVDVAPAVADEADDRHPEPLPRLDGE